MSDMIPAALEQADNPAPETIAITIDGEPWQTKPGASLLTCLNERHGQFASLCVHPSLGPIELCDTCFVTVDGNAMRACGVMVRPGMVVETNGKAATLRQEALARLLRRHDLYCTICDNNDGHCELQGLVRRMGTHHQPRPYRSRQMAVDDSNPFYQYDPNQCILCGRCVEACQNVQVNETLSIDWSAPVPRVVWDGGVPIDESSCVSCGHCVTVCPCNALMEKSMLGASGPWTAMSPQATRHPQLTHAAIDYVKGLEKTTGFGPIMELAATDQMLRGTEQRRTKTVCTYCGVGCSFDVVSVGRRILQIQPVPEAPANGISSCVKGKFGYSYVTSAERLTTPLVRDQGRLRQASWEEALGRIAETFGAIARQHGADALGFIASSKCSNEEAYLTQKLARAVYGTNNIDNCSRYCQNPATMGLFRTVGYGGDSGPLADLHHADCVLIVGSNTAESHPVFATRVKRAHKLHGQTLVVVDPLRHEMAQRADLHLRPHPGSDIYWINAICRALVEQDLVDHDFIEHHTEGFASWEAALKPFTMEHACVMTGLAMNELEQLLAIISGSKRLAILWAMGITQHSAGSDTSTALSNLLLLGGHYGRPGAGAYPLRGHNNVQGTSDFGALPGFYPGYEHAVEEGGRKKWSAFWGVDLPATPGLTNHGMVEAALRGDLKGLYIVGEEMALVDANAQKVARAFENLEMLVVQDIFLSETARFADVVLPGCPSLEKEGTFVNTERRIQRFEPAFAPLGESRPDWMILRDVARCAGANWNYEGPAAIMTEAAAGAALLAGVSYERLAGYASLQWPVAADGTGTRMLFADRIFPLPGGKARFYPLGEHVPLEQVDEQYDCHLNNGRLLEHFHEGNMTGHSPGLRAKVPDAFLEISAELAQERGIENGTWVRIVSRRGAIKVRAQISDRVHGRELYLPMNSRTEPVNRLTGDHVDKDTDTPAFKELAVYLEVLQGDKPVLGRNHHRFGHPTPRSGVEARRKRQRDDYVALDKALSEESGL